MQGQPYTARHLRTFQLITLIVALLSLIGYWVYINIIHHAPWYNAADPEWLHTMASLGVFKGQGYLYTDPPGTPLNVIGTGLYALTFPFIGGPTDAFVRYHLEHPEIVLLLGRGFLLLISLVTVVLYARYAFRLTDWIDVLASVAVPLSFFAINPLGFRPLVQWSHNAVAFSLGALLLLGLLQIVRNRANTPRWHILGLGFAAGVLTAFHLNFAAWVIGIIVTLGLLELAQKRWRAAFFISLSVGISSLLGFFVATLPIINQYPKFFNFVFGLISHQGLYGQGEPGFINVETFVTNLEGIVRATFPTVVAIGLVLALLAVLFIWQRRKFRQHWPLWALVFGVLVQAAAIAFLIVKHPGLGYVGALVAVVPVLLAVAITVLKFRSSVALALRMGIAIGLIGLYVRRLDQWVVVHNNEVATAEQVQAELPDKLNGYAHLIGVPPSALKIVWTHGPWTYCSAFWQGSEISGRIFDTEGRLLCPNSVFLNLWGRMVEVPGREPIPLADYHDWDVIITVRPFLEEDAPYLNQIGYHMPGPSDFILIFASDPAKS